MPQIEFNISSSLSTADMEQAATAAVAHKDNVGVTTTPKWLRSISLRPCQAYFYSRTSPKHPGMSWRQQ